MTSLTDRAALEQYGIAVADVRIKRLNLPEQNKQSVYARMRAERERIARQYRAEGEEQALSIRADADRQKEEILSVAYKEAEKVKGEGDAEATRTYSQAYSKNPAFYKLLRTLDSYKKIFDDKTTAILSSDSELLKVLMHGGGGEVEPVSATLLLHTHPDDSAERRVPTAAVAWIGGLLIAVAADQHLYCENRSAGGGDALRRGRRIRA